MPPSRPADAPSISQTATGNVTNSTGQALTGASASTDTAPGDEGDRGAPPAEGEHHRMGKAREPRARCGVHDDPLCGLASRRGRRRVSASRLARGAPSGRPLRGDAQPLHAPRIGIEHLDLELARTRHHLAARRKPPDPRHDVAGERVDFARHFADVEFGPDGRDDVLERRARIGEERAVGLAHHGGRFVVVVLVLDVADDLLDDVLDRRDAVGAAILVDHQRQMDARRLHLGEQVDRRHRGRHEQHLADDLGRPTARPKGRPP